jgi:hypothetical protein
MTAKLLAAFSMIAISVTATVQAAKPPLHLKQTSPWNVDYADDRCRLMRKFGEGDEEVYAVFDRFGPGEQFRLTLAGKIFKTSLEKGKAAVMFGPAEEEQQLNFSSGSFGEFPAFLFDSQARLAPLTASEQAAIDKSGGEAWIDLTPVGPAREAAIRNLTVNKPLRQALILETGSMRKPLEALGKCVDNLMTIWGIDVEKHKSLTQRVKPLTSPGKWVVSQDYPAKMLSAGQPAIVEFRLSVGADGKPVSCHIQLTTRPKEFDAAVCGSLMKRARFKPALDADGKPLASYYRNTVRFALP